MAESNFCVLDSDGAPYQGLGPAIICYGSFVIANFESPTGEKSNGNLSFNGAKGVRSWWLEGAAIC